MKLNLYDNTGKLVQYVAHIRNDKLDHVVSHEGERLSQGCGEHVFVQSQKGLVMLSEVLGHSEDVPERFCHCLNMGQVNRRLGRNDETEN